MNEYKKELEKGQSDFVILLLVFIPLLLVFELLKSIFTTKSKYENRFKTNPCTTGTYSRFRK